MNILGLRVSIDRSPTATMKWTRPTIAMGVVILCVLGGGVAYASWSANGTGVGSAKAGTSAGVTASATTSTSSTLLYPGGTAPIVVNIHNPNPFSVKVTAISLSTEAAPDSVTGGAGGCTTANALVSLTAISSATGLPVSIAANSDGTVTMNGSPVAMNIASDNTCQGATFNFTTGVTVTASAG